MCMTANQINYWNLQETKRSNLAREAETQRHNTKVEDYNTGSLLETSRHNQATEGEATRHNVQSENLAFITAAEVARHNKASEGLDRSKINVQQGQLNETIRHNREQDSWRGYENYTDRMNAETQQYAAQHKAYNDYYQAMKARSEAKLNETKGAEIEYNMATGPLQMLTRSMLPIMLSN